MSEAVKVEAAKPGDAKKGNIFARIWQFIREVVAEMKLVVYPTRDELWTYFLVVLVFVLVLMAFTGVIDLLFGFAANWAFTLNS